MIQFIGFEQLLWLLYEPLLIIGFEQLVWLYRYINSITFQNAISLFLSYLEKANRKLKLRKADQKQKAIVNQFQVVTQLKKKFEDDESDKSDTSSESNISNNDHVPVILKDIPKRSEDYDDDDSDEPFLDNEDYNNGNPIPNNEDYDKNSDSAYISEENDELTDDDKEFEESEMTNINDDELIQGLRLLHTKVLHSISDIAFNKILDNVNSNLTIYKLKKKINSIVPFEPHRYDTCKNSCIAFTSSYENLASCPICGENRFDDNGKPVNTTFFFSVKERLIIQYKNKERAEELQYRSNYSQNKGEEEIYADIFDGLLYKDLLQRGPRSPKNFNSFLCPLIKELQELEGIANFNI
ncbi:transposase domain-containing protein [Rhizophagus irregularis DAOM 181602=DAOM 197198]|nr:transposase domain-containing protein [Rhizophagus irregularis DAOM 181602=DAOM 197198]